MKPIKGERVFFKRKALARLRSYWCRRWDNVELRQRLSLDYEPKYHVEAEHMNSFYVKLSRLDFVWYRGLFSVGRHLESGRYYHDPVHLSLRGLGPREMVFPESILSHLTGLTLLGNWVRYQLCASGFLGDGEKPQWSRHLESQDMRMTVRVSEVKMAEPPPVVTRWGTRARSQQTLCLRGIALVPPACGLRDARPDRGLAPCRIVPILKRKSVSSYPRGGRASRRRCTIRQPAYETSCARSLDESTRSSRTVDGSESRKERVRSCPLRVCSSSILRKRLLRFAMRCVGSAFPPRPLIVHPVSQNSFSSIFRRSLAATGGAGQATMAALKAVASYLLRISSDGEVLDSQGLDLRNPEFMQDITVEDLRNYPPAMSGEEGLYVLKNES